MIIRLDDPSLPSMLSQAINEGWVFVYPTDTVYGIGADASNARAVSRIRMLKKTDHPFSVIAPSVDWIAQNFVITKAAKPWLKKLPGPYTLILQKLNPSFLSKASRSGTLGVRIPGHKITALLQLSKKPIITTSANISGHPTITHISQLEFDVDLVISAGTLNGQPSKIIDCTKDYPAEIQRKK